MNFGFYFITSIIREDSATEPIRKLREHERNYEKPQVKEIYDSLKDREENALKNAERLRRYHKSNGSDLHSTSTNPYTNVDEIISFINSF